MSKELIQPRSFKQLSYLWFCKGLRDIKCWRYGERYMQAMEKICIAKYSIKEKRIKGFHHTTGLYDYMLYMLQHIEPSCHGFSQGVANRWHSPYLSSCWISSHNSTPIDLSTKRKSWIYGPIGSKTRIRRSQIHFFSGPPKTLSRVWCSGYHRSPVWSLRSVLMLRLSWSSVSCRAHSLPDSFALAQLQANFSYWERGEVYTAATSISTLPCYQRPAKRRGRCIRLEIIWPCMEWVTIFTQADRLLQIILVTLSFTYI